MQLVINTFGASLKRKGDRFLVRAGSNRMSVSAAKVQSILVTTAVHLSSDVLVLAVTHNIDVVLDKNAGRNRRRGHAEAGRDGQNAQRRAVAGEICQAVHRCEYAATWPTEFRQ